MAKNDSARPMVFTKFEYPNLIAGFTSKKDGDFSPNILKDLKTTQLLEKINKPINSFKKFHFMEQVHGTKIERILRSDPYNLNTPQGSDLFGNFIKGADGLITSQKGILLLIKTADCLPVLIFDSKKQVIAAIHSGWRGTVGKITQKAILKMVNEFGCRPCDLFIGVGPCAHQCCYTHDKKAFVRHLPEWENFSKKKGDFYYIDLVGKLKSDLIDIGVKPKNIEIVPICTICDKRFFSHARHKEEKEKQGLFISYIGLTKETPL